MCINDVEKCLADLDNKKCEGFDIIPVCAIYDARAILLAPLSSLFQKIYAFDNKEKTHASKRTRLRSDVPIQLFASN